MNFFRQRYRYIFLFCLGVAFCAAAFMTYINSTTFSCNQLIQEIPDEFHDMPINSCQTGTDLKNRQALAIVTFRIPASRVKDIEGFLISNYGMKPLRFVCCGYEARPVSHELSDRSPLLKDVPSGAIRGITMRLWAPGLEPEDGSGPSSKMEFYGIGEVDGYLTVTLIDV